MWCFWLTDVELCMKYVIKDKLIYTGKLFLAMLWSWLEECRSRLKYHTNWIGSHVILDRHSKSSEDGFLWLWWPHDSSSTTLPLWGWHLWFLLDCLKKYNMNGWDLVQTSIVPRGWIVIPLNFDVKPPGGQHFQLSSDDFVRTFMV